LQGSHGPRKISGKISSNEQPVAGVLVRLKMLIPHDSISIADVVQPEDKTSLFSNGIKRDFIKDSAGRDQLESLVAYARTSQDGSFSFEGLAEGSGYELIPLQPGFQFGRSKGVQRLDKDLSFSFEQSPHTIKLFSTADFNNFKKEKSFIVRTPEAARGLVPHYRDWIHPFILVDPSFTVLAIRRR
jgi:hypothetical protein